MPTLNGKTYEMQYLTDEETAVIEAMRKGGQVEVYFFDSTTEAADEHALSLITLAEYDVREITTFVSHDIRIGKHTIYHFVDK